MIATRRAKFSIALNRWVTNTIVVALVTLKSMQQFHDRALGFQIHPVGRLIEQQRVRLSGQRPRDKDALLLTARQPSIWLVRQILHPRPR